MESVGLLAEVTRGNRVESQHFGRAVVVDAHGQVVWSCGDHDAVTYPRSTVKALLGLELVESGAAERLQLSDAELALTCASHGGEAAHAEVALRLLQRVGRGVEALECGAHWPTYEPAGRALAQAGQQACPLHNNCSGKHAGLICLACDSGVDPEGYIEPDHQIQKRVTRVLEEVTGAAHREEERGTDGCSMPTYAIPLRALAHGFARFGSGVGLTADRARAAKVLREAVAKEPFMVAGTGRYDTALMKELGLGAFIKMGAEGVMVAALPDEGLGIAIKINDGANRAAEVAMSALMARFGGSALLGKAASSGVLEQTAHQSLRNWQGRDVGIIRAASILRRSDSSK
ncbi:L-asparaginase II [Neokomagataea tanensis NBRC 106556]|uniref:L-asparaginase II n=2 Tax=Acetobacteraceae TaxID=433 RepID=A0ABQ0QGT0_9PROT|nr:MULTISPECIES: asparaginase [Neokomagataea]GBR44086.1 L-asparaginase II [Neokomagataea tanensis NBRC 106556]